MAIFRSLTKFAHKTRKPLLFISTPTPNPTTFRNLRSSSSPYSIRNPNGPLFMCYPPWKLILSATPVYYQSTFKSPETKPPIKLNLDLPKNYGRDFDNIKRRDSVVVEGRSGTDGLLVNGVVNWPNFISITRLLSGPLLGWMIMHDMYLPAFLGLAVSGATDWLDGYVARKMGINSVVGSYLDPLADKVLIGCVAVAMVERGLLHSGLVALVVMRDIVLVGGALYIRANHIGSKSRSWSEFFNLDGIRPQKVEPLMISKVNTCFQLALVAGALLQPEFGTQETELYITYLSWLVASTTLASTTAYGIKHLRNKPIFI